MSGVTSTGFELQTLQETLTNISNLQLASIDPSLDNSPSGFLGQWNASYAREIATLWEVAQTCYNGFNIDAAEGALLTALCALTGTVRLGAKKSKVSCTLNLNSSTTVPVGSIIYVVGQSTIRFVLVDADVVSTTAGNYPGTFEAEVTGPVVANAGTLTQISTPVGGWNSVTNALDANLGRNVETDAQLRIRQRQELSAPGAGTVDAIRADLLQLTGMSQVFVFENTSNVTNSDGMPPHSIECVIFDGPQPFVLVDDNDIVDTIWRDKPAGILTYGDTLGTATDSLGIERNVYFSRAVNKNVFISLTVQMNSDWPGTGGVQNVKDALVAYGTSKLTLGKDVIRVALEGAAIDVIGVEDVTVCTLGFTASPVGTSNLTISDREIALIDASRIVVTTV